jgi:hypothetical protein
VTYELDFYIPEDGILHSQRRESLKSYKEGSVWVSIGETPFASGKWIAVMLLRV